MKKDLLSNIPSTLLASNLSKETEKQLYETGLQLTTELIGSLTEINDELDFRNLNGRQINLSSDDVSRIVFTVDKSLLPYAADLQRRLNAFVFFRGDTNLTTSIDNEPDYQKAELILKSSMAGFHDSYAGNKVGTHMWYILAGVLKGTTNNTTVKKHFNISTEAFQNFSDKSLTNLDRLIEANLLASFLKKCIQSQKS